MENKKLGILLVVFSLVLLIFMNLSNKALSRDFEELGCSMNDQCAAIEKNLSMTNIGFGFFGFMLALGFYILFFNKTEEKILKRLEDDKDKRISDEKFSFALKLLSPVEAKVLRLVRESPGITQSHLRVKSELSKAKLSYVLQDLEKRSIIKREEKGKGLSVWLKI